MSEKNQGDQVLLGAQLAGVSNNDFVKVVKLISGQRSGGFHEVQLLTVILQDSNDITELAGWMRLAFKGVNTASPWVHSDASNEDMERAINEVKTIRPVKVIRSLVEGTYSSGVHYIGYQWRIELSGDWGNQPALIVDGSNLRSTRPGGAQVLVTLNDGDNSLSVTGYKASNAFPGEYPADYHSMIVPATATSVVVPNLIPGTFYNVAVAAINAFGTGAALLASPTDGIKPPLQIPQPPSRVSVDVHYGSSTSLDITYGAPDGDGGAVILNYRLEIDTSSRFLNPIFTVVNCPAANTHSIFELVTSGSVNDPIVGGYFQLDLQFNGKKFTTDYIPYDSVATAAEELGVILRLGSLFATVQPSSPVVQASGSTTGLVFPGDRLQFDVQLDSKDFYTVVTVNNTNITLDRAIVINTGKFNQSLVTSTMTRLLGGIGNDENSRVACDTDFTTATLCPPARRQVSGSIQSKLQMIPEALLLGVDVDRDAPDNTNGVHWRVTFLDEAEIGNLDFQLTLTPGSSTLRTLSGQAANFSITNLQTGQVFESCIGTKQIPVDGKKLTKGQLYYARVFAVNQVGFSLAANAPTPQKPMVVPGPPTSVVLAVANSTGLRVSWNPPADDGGDTITLYRVDYSLTSAFDVYSSVNVTYLAGGTNYFKTITGLQTGVFYFIRVLAYNSQGFGLPAIR